MATDFVSLFTTLGLSKIETSVYLANFRLGPTSVQEIAKKANVSRTACYEAIDSLQERGLISTFTRGKKRFFSAEDPDRALKYFRDHISGMTSTLDDLKRALPEMSLLAGGDRPTVRFYEGREALFVLFNDMAQVRPKRLDEVSNMDDVYDLLDLDYLKEVRKVVDPTRMETRILHRGKVRGAPRPHVQYKEMSSSFGNFHGDIWIYSDRVAFVSFVGKVMTVIVENQVFAETMRALFETAWQA